MKKYFGLLSLIFLFCNMQALRFISIKTGQEIEGPDQITFKNDLDEPVKIEGRMYLLDGCCPIDSVFLASKKDHSLKGPDAWGLSALTLTLASTKYEINFDGESFRRSLPSNETIEFIIKISDIISANKEKGKKVSLQIIRSEKSERL